MKRVQNSRLVLWKNTKLMATEHLQQQDNLSPSAKSKELYPSHPSSIHELFLRREVLIELSPLSIVRRLGDLVRRPGDRKTLNLR
jgi:hypothetical protein